MHNKIMDEFFFSIADCVMHNICSGMSGYIDEEEHYFISLSCIIRTVVRIVGMGRMSHICNTKCSRL